MAEVVQVVRAPERRTGVASPLPVPQPTLAARALGQLSSSIGSPVLDGAAGAAIAYLVAPPSKKVGYAIGGGLASGFFGLLGLGGTLVWRAFDKG
jgi:hypothetical protein